VTRILIGVDSSQRSEDAVAFAARLARAGRAELVVAAVNPEGDEAERLGEPLGARIVVVEAPSAAHGLHELAEAEGAALVVVGSTHTGPLGRVRPGSTGERLLAGAPCAVAVAPHGYRALADTGFGRIGAAWDGSAESSAALASAISAARAFGARLEILTVLSPNVAAMTTPAYVAVLGDVERDLQGDLDEVVEATSELVRTEGVLLHGRPWRELAERSAELDLLFAGSRGYGPGHAVLTGGTSGPLMSHAHCPTVILPRGASAPLAEVFEAAWVQG